VLADPAGFGKRLHWFMRLATLAPAGLVSRRSRLSARQVRRVLRLVYFDSPRIEDEEVERIRELALLPGNCATFLQIGRSSAGVFRGVRPALGLGEPPAEITVTTLVLWGRGDRLVPVSHAEQVRAICRDADLTVFERCGHCP
jgi:pimeloyl-ACP methyl ester carboxylesterase